MSMQEFPDDSLDELFRKSAEEFEPDFDPQAWAAMRKKLDNNEGFKKRPALLPIILLLLLLSVFSVGGYLLWPQLKTMVSKDSADTSNVTQQSQTSTATNQPKTAGQNENGLSPENTVNHPSQNELTQQTELKQAELKESNAVLPANPSENKTVVSGKASASDLPSLIDKKGLAANTEKNIASELPSRTSTESDKIKRFKKTTDQKGKETNPRLSTEPNGESLAKRSFSNVTGNTNKKPVRNSDTSDTKDSGVFDNTSKTKRLTARGSKKQTPQSERSGLAKPTSTESAPANLTAVPSVTESKTEIPNTIINTPNELSIHQWKLLDVARASAVVSYTSPPPPLAVAKAPKATAAPAFQKGLSVRILGAPDLSFIGFDQIKRPGTTVGALLEYRFSQRFSLQAGAIQTMKLYDALGSQYVWPEAWYSQKARPVSIEAACKVLDIPINLRYDISQASDRRWFVSTGISSYKMLNEKYTYNYAPHTYGIKWPGWEGSTGSYRFGILNLSMGFERQIGKNFTLQAEPYFKVPLAQVGLGKIKLNTTGLYISARYRLGRF